MLVHTNWQLPIEKQCNRTPLDTTVLTNYSIFRRQHGHRSRRARSAAASSIRSVVMESGTWRCLRRGAPGPEAFG